MNRDRQAVAELLSECEICGAVCISVVLRETDRAEAIGARSDRNADSRAFPFQTNLAAGHGREIGGRLDPRILRRPDFQNPRGSRSPDAVDHANVTQNAQRGAPDRFEHRLDFQRDEMTTHIREKHCVAGYDLRRRRPLHRLHPSTVLSRIATCQIDPASARRETRSARRRPCLRRSLTGRNTKQRNAQQSQIEMDKRTSCVVQIRSTRKGISQGSQGGERQDCV